MPLNKQIARSINLKLLPIKLVVCYEKFKSRKFKTKMSLDWKHDLDDQKKILARVSRTPDLRITISHYSPAP
jgi:hypothetical protein